MDPCVSSSTAIIQSVPFQPAQHEIIARWHGQGVNNRTQVPGLGPLVLNLLLLLLQLLDSMKGTV